MSEVLDVTRRLPLICLITIQHRTGDDDKIGREANIKVDIDEAVS